MPTLALSPPLFQELLVRLITNTPPLLTTIVPVLAFVKPLLLNASRESIVSAPPFTMMVPDGSATDDCARCTVNEVVTALGVIDIRNLVGCAGVKDNRAARRINVGCIIDEQARSIADPQCPAPTKVKRIPGNCGVVSVENQRGLLTNLKTKTGRKIATSNDRDVGGRVSGLAGPGNDPKKVQASSAGIRDCRDVVT